MKTFEEVKVCPHCGALSEEHFSGDEGWSFCSDECGCIEGEKSVYKFQCSECGELCDEEKCSCSKMKTYSFLTCKGALRFAAPSRFAALRLFHQLVRKTRGGKYIPIAKEKRELILSHGETD